MRSILRSYLRPLRKRSVGYHHNIHMRPSAMTIMTRILECDQKAISFFGDRPDISSETTLDALKLASHHLVDLEDVVAFPTETVYGLGANALNPNAIAKIFSTKGRPSDNPLIVHVSSYSMLTKLLPKDYKLSRTYDALIRSFWPGALTLLFPADSSIVPSTVTAGHPTVGVRMPSHLVARALIALADTPLAAPSANSSGKPSPTRAEHVFTDLKGKIELILDGGICPIGLESTVVDGLQSDGHLRVLRPGGVTVEDLERVMKEMGERDDGFVPRVLVHRRDYRDEDIESAPTTPGMKYRHYAPSVPVVLIMTAPPSNGTLAITCDTLVNQLNTSFEKQAPEDMKIGLLAPLDSFLTKYLSSTTQSLKFHSLGIKGDPATSAARLFDGLLTLESQGADVILVEGVPEHHEGLAFMNRARKAAGLTWWVKEDLETITRGVDLMRTCNE